MASLRKAKADLLTHALSLPGAWEDHPWEETVAKVGKRVFVFFGRDGPELFVGLKLPKSLLLARSQPFSRKFGYGMDAHEWVALRFAKGEDVPVSLVRGWIDESYEAVAPKKLARATTGAPEPARRAVRRKRSS